MLVYMLVGAGEDHYSTPWLTGIPNLISHNHHNSFYRLFMLRTSIGRDRVTCQGSFNGYMMIGFELSGQSMAKRKVQLRRPPRFELLGGNVALDFVNTLDNRPSAEPTELLKEYSDLARFTEDTEILTKQQADYFYEHALRRPDEAEAAMRQARALREALHAMFWA